MMKQVIVAFSVIIILIIIACSPINKKVDEKPNVLIIFPDQLRRYSAGYWSEEPFRQHVIGVPDPAVTPVIDKLAKNGVVFTNAISNYPLCSPYRGMMLTGQYPEQNGIWGNCRIERDYKLRDDVKTITDYFYEYGYNTAYFGKCHWEKTEALFDKDGNYMGTLNPPGGNYVNAFDTYVPPGPARHNIEYFYQALKDSHYDSRVYSNDPEVIDGKADGQLHRPRKFSAKNEAEQIVKYIKNTHGQRDTNKPFCMIWALNPPHNPWDDKNTEMDMVQKYYGTDKYAEIKDLVLRENADLEVANYARNYFANVSATDKYIGLVLEELENQGILDNTIVVFSSDHGEMLGSHGKQGKNVLETEAIAIPFIVHYPAKLKPAINTNILGATDVLPTILGLAGLTDNMDDEIQGKNFTDELIFPSKSNNSNGEAALLLLGNSRGIYTKNYTFGIQEDNDEIDRIYFYENTKDPYQKNSLNPDDFPLIKNSILVELGKKLKETNDPWYQGRKYKDYIIYPD